jgi:Protein of unknown function (DUF2855)
MMPYQLIVARKAIRQAQLHSFNQIPLAPGQARLHIEQFALTANNITYAVFGEAMQYWQFFPTIEAMGCIPVWGFGQVVESSHPDITVGQRYYGYYPMGNELVVQAGEVHGGGFTDTSAHRAPLHKLYNQYLNTTKDPSYNPQTESQQSLLRPLFLTSFVIEDFFDDNRLFDAQQVVISSASSKTSYGTAFAFAHRKREQGNGPTIVGLTSASNRAFVQSLGCYDLVVAYEDINTIALAPSVYIDMAGGVQQRTQIHTHLQDHLKYSCVIGNTQWEQGVLGASEKSAPLPGAKPTFFFAPTQIKKRFSDWTPAGFAQRFAKSWQALMQPVMAGTPAWMTVREHQGQEALMALYAKVVAGELDPRDGHIVRP